MKKGIIAGAFDIIHPGYIHMFKYAKTRCEHLTIALHIDPSIERNKLKPILSSEDRIDILSSIKYIDDIVVYNTENNLIDLLSSNIYDIRFLGEDYKNNKYTGEKIPIKVDFISRNHNWSTTKFKMAIYDSIKKNIELNEKFNY